MSNQGTYLKRKRVRRLAKQQNEINKLVDRIRNGSISEEQALNNATNKRIERRIIELIDRAEKGKFDLSVIEPDKKPLSRAARRERDSDSRKEKLEKTLEYQQWIKDGRLNSEEGKKDSRCKSNRKILKKTLKITNSTKCVSICKNTSPGTKPKKRNTRANRKQVKSSK